MIETSVTKGLKRLNNCFTTKICQFTYLVVPLSFYLNMKSITGCVKELSWNAEISVVNKESINSKRDNIKQKINYYKLRQLLQNETIIKECEVTKLLVSPKLFQSNFKSVNNSIKLMLLEGVESTPKQRLLVQRQQWEHLNNVWNQFKVSNKDTRRCHLASSSLASTSHIARCFYCWQ